MLLPDFQNLHSGTSVVTARQATCSFLARLPLCSNDAFDAKTGVDKTKRESVVNLTGNRTLVLVLANVLLVAGVSLLATLISTTADARPALMLAFSIACGYVYQGPPFR